jgi:hypothetical protein
MIVIPMDIKLQCSFGVIDTDTNAVIKKETFNVDIQKLDPELFKQACESLEKIRAEILNNLSENNK